MARPFGEKKRSAILSAATARIARAAGVAEGTVFTDFPTKDALLNELQGTRSTPDVTVDAIWMALNDGDQGRVRSYSGPDGEIIPRAQQMLGRGLVLARVLRRGARPFQPIMDVDGPNGRRDCRIQAVTQAVWR